MYIYIYIYIYYIYIYSCQMKLITAFIQVLAQRSPAAFLATRLGPKDLLSA